MKSVTMAIALFLFIVSPVFAIDDSAQFNYACDHTDLAFTAYAYDSSISITSAKCGADYRSDGGVGHVLMLVIDPNTPAIKAAQCAKVGTVFTDAFYGAEEVFLSLEGQTFVCHLNDHDLATLSPL